MSDSPEPSEKTKSKRGGMGRSLLVWAAVLFTILPLVYMTRLPAALHWPVRILFFASVLWLAYSIFRALRSTKFDTKRVVFSLVLIAMFYGALFLICTVFVKLMSAKDERMATVQTTSLTDKARRVSEKLMHGVHPAVYDKEVGWVPRPDYQWKNHFINEQSMRGKRIYPETSPDPDKRILCFGDSFTFGYEVDDDQTFPYHGEQLRPGTEWPNFGICGAGLTQALVHYRKNGRKFDGKYVVIGFMTNNVKRTVNSFRGFVSPSDITPYTKPFAKLTDDGQLSIEPNPYQEVSDYQRLLDNEKEELKRLYELDYLTWSKQRASTNPIVRTLRYVWERREGDRNLALLLNRPLDDYGTFRAGDDPYGSSIWHPDSPGFQANAKVFDLFYQEVIDDGKVPIIVVLPSANDVEGRQKGKPTVHRALLEYFDEKGYLYFDALDTLEKAYGDKLSPKSVFVNTHLNGEANKLVAEEIIKALSL